jgi:hypothetical protein
VRTNDSVAGGRNDLASGRLPKYVIARVSGAGFAGICGMPNPHATSSACTDGCDLSWTTGMPVHPDPAPGISPSRLPRKDLRELVVLSAVCVISTIVFVPPIAGVVRSASEPSTTLVARDLYASAALVQTPKPVAATMSPVATSAIDARVVRTASTRRAQPRADRRAMAAKIGRALAGDGRHRVRPFPRP